MKCPFCQHLESKVSDSRLVEDGDAVRRRRECLECGKRFTTYERLDEIPLLVVKKDGRLEVFNHNKIITGVFKACEKRPIGLETIEDLVDSIERELRNRTDHEVTSKRIGEMVMERLRELDEVAYVRFASVYREFRDASKFIQILKNLKNS
ncbi:MAG: transcriptional regulator NrdR [bacterium]|nr:transcriptional regulator NrdR [bacterium]MDD3806287.1 transcriptional regulator NrdR [bacterium]MDD4152313.1 transcriptional regulator NrdR [bacterium]MDD4558855.1 transcriptional regulator NrdR [bacterium]